MRLRQKTLEIQDRGKSGGSMVELVEELASTGIDALMVWTQARGLGAGIEIVKALRWSKKRRATAEMMMNEEISSATLLLQSLAFSNVAHTEVARKQDEKVMTQHRVLGRTPPTSHLGYIYINTRGLGSVSRLKIRFSHFLTAKCICCGGRAWTAGEWRRSPRNRKRKPNTPAFIKTPSTGHRLSALIKTDRAIPKAREALLNRNQTLQDCGHEKDGWDGTPVRVLRIVNMDADGQNMIENDVVYEAQRLMAFLDKTDRAYGSTNVLRLRSVPHPDNVGLGRAGRSGSTSSRSGSPQTLGITQRTNLGL